MLRFKRECPNVRTSSDAPAHNPRKAVDRSHGISRAFRLEESYPRTILDQHFACENLVVQFKRVDSRFWVQGGLRFVVSIQTNPPQHPRKGD